MAAHTTPFALLLRRFRGRAGLTQAKLAERAGLSTDAITKLERGERQAPRCDTVQVLARALHLTTRDLRALEDAAHYTPRSVVQPATASLCVDALLQSLTELHAHHAAILDTIVTADHDPRVRAGTAHSPST
jgi:transcriptional regulator with XRE-family HTH domain